MPVSYTHLDVYKRQVEISFKVPERAYVAWPEAIRQGFEPARTVKTGTLQTDLLPPEARA